MPDCDIINCSFNFSHDRHFSLPKYTERRCTGASLHFNNSCWLLWCVSSLQAEFRMCLQHRSLTSYTRTPLHFFFCFAVWQNSSPFGCSSPLFCFHVGPTAKGLLSSLTQFKYRWALRATSTMARLWPRIFCCISTMEAVAEETLLEIPVPKATPMQWSPPAAGGETRVFKQCRCSLSIATTTSSAFRLQCEVAEVWISLVQAGLLRVQDSKRWWQAFCNNS